MTNSTVQRETVVGVFSSQDAAQRAIQRLQDAGFKRDDIGILMQDKQAAQDLADETGTKAGEAAGIGATSGGLLGAIGGLLVGLGVMAIPGIGPVLAAGPIVAALGPIIGGTLTGAAIGAGTGALAGALIGLGIPEDEAKAYEEHFNQGGILVTVKAGASRYAEAERLLRQEGAEQIDFSGATGAAARTTSTIATNTNVATTSAAAMQSGSTTTSNADVIRVPVVEESLSATKQQREAGEVTIRKNVVEEQVSIPVELRHEEVTVTRHVVDRPLQAGEQVLEDGAVIRVPLHEETVNVSKEARVTGEVEINKQVVAEQHTVSDTVRHEVVDVDTVGGVETRGSQSSSVETYESGSTSSTDTKNR